MENNQLYYALWAEDINQYLHTAFNAKCLGEVRKGIFNYISVDNDDFVELDSVTISQLLAMTGLKLDVSKYRFNYRDENHCETTNVRQGKRVNLCYLQ